jgi:hypothetical protein
MRGSDERTGELFSYVDIEERVPKNLPLRLIRRLVNEVLAQLDGEFAKLYADDGRSLDCAGATAAGAVAAGVLHHPLGASMAPPVCTENLIGIGLAEGII